jgi:hypothetical protein
MYNNNHYVDLYGNRNRPTIVLRNMNVKFYQNLPNRLRVVMQGGGGIVHRRRKTIYLAHVLPCTREGRSDLVPSPFYILRGFT